MSSRCLCFNIADKSEYDLWSNTHLPKPKLINNYIAIKPWQGCDECSEACYIRGGREQYNLWALKTYEKRKAALDTELDQLKTERDAINKATYFEKVRKYF